MGYILTCSEHGLFAYDGRVFTNLGVDQGLMNGGYVLDAAILADGRIAVRFPDQIFVSSTATSEIRPPESLRFKPLLQTSDGAYFNLETNYMAPWADGLAVIVSGQLRLFRAPGPDTLRPAAGETVPDQIAGTPTGVFNVAGSLWETLSDGRACRVAPGPGRCWTSGAGDEPFESVGPGDQGDVLARSDHLLATIDPISGRETVEALPFQGGAYDAHQTRLGLLRDQRGELVTQARDGLIVRQATGWQHLTTHDGIPAGVIATVLPDRNGQVWIGVPGRGIYRGLGYGTWENMQQGDGLSDGIPWQERRDRSGSLWVATDAALDEVRQVDGRAQVIHSVPGASYAISQSNDGKIWAGRGTARVIEIDPATRRVESFDVPAVQALAPGRGRMWLGTDHGLFHIDDQAGGRSPTRDSIDKGPVIAVTADGYEGAFFITAGRLWHRHDGRVALVGGNWPAPGFAPLTMIADGRDGLWLGGAGGLFRLRLRDDRVQSLVQVGQDDIRTNTIVALCRDSRGWLWVGTGLGVSVFDGKHWASVNSTKGLVWDDVSQNGIYEDTDGTMWIATSLGLSHLLEPKRLFAQAPPTIVISSMRIGASVMRRTKLPYGHEPLSIDLGTVSFPSEDSTVFRYRLSGVDRTWTESATGAIRYATLPPGRHLFEAYAIDTLTDARSAPVSLAIAVAYPWWGGWWAYAAYAVGLFSLVSGVARLAGAVVEARRREADALVALRRQATTDSLTGLMNRSEVERRLAADLAENGRSSIAVAIVDVDHFKSVNDEYGHLFGDTVLREFGRKAGLSLGLADYAGRYGGEEILLVFDDSDGLAIDRVTGFHQAVRECRFDAGKRKLSVTCSIGVAWHRATDEWESLIGRADAALYRAKRTGRDKIIEDRWNEDDQPGVAGMARLITDDAD